MLLTMLVVIALSTLIGAAVCAGGIQLILRFMGRPQVMAQNTSNTQAQ
jgi:hypothetical protein